MPKSNLRSISMPLSLDESISYVALSIIYSVPRGCELAFTLDGNRIQPDPNYRSYTIANRLKKKAYYIQVTSNLQNDE